jgi:hypothetical protein
MTVGILSTSESIAFKHKVIRDISPPEATFLKGFNRSPGLVEM